MKSAGTAPGRPIAGPSRLAARRASLLAFLGALALATAGCASTSVPATGDTALDLRHEDPRIRAAAAKRAVQEGRSDLIALLVGNLLDADGAVRLFTAVALRKLTGQDHGYNASDPPGARARAIEEWNAWIASQRGPVGTEPAPPPEPDPSRRAPDSGAGEPRVLPAGTAAGPAEDLGWKP